MMKWEDRKINRRSEEDDEVIQSIKITLSGILFGLLLLMAVTPSLQGGDMASVQVTVEFVDIQELAIESNIASVAVEKRGDTKTSTKIDLDNLQARSDLYLPDAIDVGITSSADWHLMARVEDTYVNPEARSSVSQVNLAISDPSGVEGFSFNNLSLAEGEEGELARKSGSTSIRTDFSVDYELELSSPDVSDLSSVGGEVIYTLMKL